MGRWGGDINKLERMVDIKQRREYTHSMKQTDGILSTRERKEGKEVGTDTDQIKILSLSKCNQPKNKHDTRHKRT